MTATFVDPLARTAVTPALERAVWALCTAVPGLVPRAIDIAPGVDGEPAVIGLTAEGWSPSLNACTIQFAGRPGPAAASIDHAVLDLLAPFVAEQAARAADALAHGIGMPADTGVAAPHHRHLHVDATHLAMAIAAAVATRSQGPDWSQEGDHDGDPMDDPAIVDRIVRDAAKTTALSHNGNARPYDGGPVIASSGCVAMQRTAADGSTVRRVGMGSQSPSAGGGRILIGNSAVGETRATLPRSGLPDTAVALLPGRAFADVFEMPHPLDRMLGPRTMGHADEGVDSLVVTLEPLDAALADVAGLTPREALARLDTLISEARP